MQISSILSSNLHSNVSRSTRINSSSVHTYIFVCFTLRVFLQGFVTQNATDTTSYTLENDILRQKIIDNGLLYTPIIVPDILKDCLLILAHDKQGHNGFSRTNALLRNRYHWKGMKKSVYQHCSRCQVCTKHNIKAQQLKNQHFSSPPQPMEFIAMDLIGEFHPASSKGNRYALTAVCMLTGFTFCIPLKSK